jgi:NitT/TauT family transport system ATP-binding protein
MNTIDIKGFGLAFDHNGKREEVLRRLDISVARGEIVGIVGPSGVGKSMLLRALMGLNRPTSGSARLSPDATAGTGAALAGEEARLAPWRRVQANVVAALEKTSLTTAQRAERAAAALESVGLAHHAQSFPHQLSSGQRQRVDLARALALRPSVLLLDEPFVGLDAPARLSLQAELLRLRDETGATILFVTRDVDEAVWLADRIVALGGHPAEAQAVVRVAAARPRRRGDPGLRDLADTIRMRMNAEAEPVDNWVI